MSIKASEISDLIRARIEKFQSANEARNVGTVVSASPMASCRIHGLADVRYGEMIEFSGRPVRPRAEPRAGFGGRRGAGRLQDASAKATPSRPRAASSKCRWARRLLGRVVDALGNPIDGKGPVNAKPSRADRARGAGRDLPQERVASRCRPATRPSMRWCRSAADSAS